MKCDLITSFIFHSHLALRMLEAVGSERRIFLVDNSFRGELGAHAQRNPHIERLRDVHHFNYEPAPKRTVLSWGPLCCAASWNLAMERAETEWVINVNPDTAPWPGALDLLELAILGRADPDIKLITTQRNFNVWAGDREYLLGLGGFDDRYYPCGAEDEDMLVRIAKDGKKWSRTNIPADHMGGGHRDRADMGMDGKTYPNAEVFEKKWGFRPHSPEYQSIVGPAFAGVKAVPA